MAAGEVHRGTTECGYWRRWTSRLHESQLRQRPLHRGEDRHVQQLRQPDRVHAVANGAQGFSAGELTKSRVASASRTAVPFGASAVFTNQNYPDEEMVRDADPTLTGWRGLAAAAPAASRRWRSAWPSSRAC